ncbi:MAG: bacteriocin immunity protein [Sporolactobacillus sp.]
MKKSQAMILNSVYDLIADPKVSDIERQSLLKAKEALEKGENDRVVTSHLKSELSVLAVKQQLSPKMVTFYTEFSRQFLGYGERGMINFTR